MKSRLAGSDHLLRYCGVAGLLASLLLQLAVGLGLLNQQRDASEWLAAYATSSLTRDYAVTNFHSGRSATHLVKRKSFSDYIAQVVLAGRFIWRNLAGQLICDALNPAQTYLTLSGFPSQGRAPPTGF